MSPREKFLSHGLGITAFALCAMLIGQQPVPAPSMAYATAPLGASIVLSSPESGSLYSTKELSVRTALRLQERLRRKGLPATLQNVVTVMRERQRLLARNVRVHFFTETGSGSTWVASTSQYPLWISMEADVSGVRIGLDEKRIEAAITPDRLGSLPVPVDTVIKAIHEGAQVDRILTEGTARPGYRLDPAAVRDALVEALLGQESSIRIHLTQIPGRLENKTGLPLGDLTLLATGYSNFKGSPWGRIANVRKALRDHVHNAVIAPGETFSFYAALGETLAEGGRWEQAKVINGGVLTMEPGGGICQASTTLYRGILQAGLPVLKRQSHSMYVSYYEVGGVGLDATVYKGKPDLTFLNDTGNALVLQAYDDGDDAYVRIYGTQDGRVATTDGPYFTGTAPDDFLDGGRPLKKNEIGWHHEVVYSDGTVKSTAIISTYKSLPRSIVAKYTTAPKVEETLALQAGVSAR